VYAYVYHVPIPFIGRGPERTGEDSFCLPRMSGRVKGDFSQSFSPFQTARFFTPLWDRAAVLSIIHQIECSAIVVVDSIVVMPIFFPCFYLVQYKYNKIFGCIYLYWILSRSKNWFLPVSWNIDGCCTLESYMKTFLSAVCQLTQLSQWRAAKMDFTIRSIRIDTLK
jgi:hypothetical protein